MFVLRPMSAFVEDLELRPRDILMHRRRLGHAAERVVRSPDDEGRRADLVQIFRVKQVALPDVHFLQRKEVGDVPDESGRVVDRVSDFDEFLADVPLGPAHQEVKALAGEVYVVARYSLGSDVTTSDITCVMRIS